MNDSEYAKIEIRIKNIEQGIADTLARIADQSDKRHQTHEQRLDRLTDDISEMIRRESNPHHREAIIDAVMKKIREKEPRPS